MPFTPFHFGPGMLIKGIAPRRYSWTAFVATQVVIDFETLYYLVRNEPPFHRALHTLVGGTAAGVATSAALFGARALARRVVPRAIDALSRQPSWVRSEVQTLPVLVGGLLGGWTHALLDGLMHEDTSPFAPWIHGDPLNGLIHYETLQLGCVVSGALGLLLVLVWSVREHANRRTQRG